HIKHLKLGRISMISPRHSQVPEQELREEGEIEPDKGNHGREFSPEFGIQASGNLGPPVMKAAHESHHHASDHDVVEMSDDEICVMDMHVDGKCRDAETSQTANGEQADKTERVKHRRLESDRARVKSRRPIEYFYSAGHSHQKAQE